MDNFLYLTKCYLYANIKILLIKNKKNMLNHIDELRKFLKIGKKFFRLSPFKNGDVLTQKWEIVDGKIFVRVIRADIIGQNNPTIYYKDLETLKEM